MKNLRIVLALSSTLLSSFVVSTTEQLDLASFQQAAECTARDLTNSYDSTLHPTTIKMCEMVLSAQPASWSYAHQLCIGLQSLPIYEYLRNNPSSIISWDEIKRQTSLYGTLLMSQDEQNTEALLVATAIVIIYLSHLQLSWNK